MVSTVVSWMSTKVLFFSTVTKYDTDSVNMCRSVYSFSTHCTMCHSDLISLLESPDRKKKKKTSQRKPYTHLLLRSTGTRHTIVDRENLILLLPWSHSWPRPPPPFATSLPRHVLPSKVEEVTSPGPHKTRDTREDTVNTSHGSYRHSSRRRREYRENDK